MDYHKEMETLRIKYTKICDKLDNLNNEAFEMEKRMLYLKRMIEGENNAGKN